MFVGSSADVGITTTHIHALRASHKLQTLQCNCGERPCLDANGAALQARLPCHSVCLAALANCTGRQLATALTTLRSPDNSHLLRFNLGSMPPEHACDYSPASVIPPTPAPPPDEPRNAPSAEHCDAPAADAEPEPEQHVSARTRFARQGPSCDR